MRLYTVYYISVNCSLYMFRVVTPPIIRSTYNCNYSIWHRSNRLCYLRLAWSSCSSCSTTATIITGICAPDDVWSYHPKHVARAVYRNIIHCIQSHLVGQLLTLIHDARSHEHKIYVSSVTFLEIFLLGQSAGVRSINARHVDGLCGSS